MLSNDELEIEHCRALLKKAAWRLQYHARMLHFRESLALTENREAIYNTYDEVVSDIFVQDLMNTITSEKCKYIIKRVVIQGFSEKDIASELSISQQGVSKWKKKGIDTIRENLIYSENY